jgi:hypothetical protein
MRNLERVRSVRTAAVIIVAAVIAGACSEEPTAVQSPPTPAFSVGQVPSATTFPGDATATLEFAEVCKVWSWGDSNPDVTITVDVDSHEGDTYDTSYDIVLPDATLAADRCVEAWLHGGSPHDYVSFTEQVPYGYAAAWTLTSVGNPNQDDSGTGGGPVTGRVKGSQGFLVEFTNYPAQGCTPGYWRNQFEEWAAAGYSTGDDFDTVFGVTLFSGTLGEAIVANGGGENALARHATAALLSASHPGLDFGDASGPLTGADIIGIMQDPSTISCGTDLTKKPNQNCVKNYFAALNERACLIG